MKLFTPLVQNGWWVGDVLKCSVVTKTNPAETDSSSSKVRITDSGFLPHLGLTDYREVVQQGKQEAVSSQ